MESLIFNKVVDEPITIFKILNINVKSLERSLKVLDNNSIDADVNKVIFKQNDSPILFFDKVEVRKDSNTYKKTILLKKQNTKAILYNLKILVDKISDLHGEDDLCRKKICLNDLLDIYHYEKFSRIWSAEDYPIELIYEKNKGIELIIKLN